MHWFHWQSSEIRRNFGPKSESAFHCRHRRCFRRCQLQWRDLSVKGPSTPLPGVTAGAILRVCCNTPIFFTHFLIQELNIMGRWTSEPVKRLRINGLCGPVDCNRCQVYICGFGLGRFRGEDNADSTQINAAKNATSPLPGLCCAVWPWQLRHEFDDWSDSEKMSTFKRSDLLEKSTWYLLNMRKLCLRFSESNLGLWPRLCPWQHNLLWALPLVPKSCRGGQKWRFTLKVRNL